MIIASLLWHTALFCQGPLKQWDARFGGSSNDQLLSLDQTTDGGYILGGYSESGISGDKTQASQGGRDYWIVKTDVNGVKQWDARFGGSSNDELYSLEQTTDGGYILGGYSLSGIGGDKTQASQGMTDYWIIKTDANGGKQWDARFGGSNDDYLLSLQQTADGGYILGGLSYSPSGGDKTQNYQGGTDYWIVKTDANGVKQWDLRFGGNLDDNFCSLQQTADSGYILGGYSLSGKWADKTQASQGSWDYWIVKTDANGVKQWDSRFGGSSDDVLRSLEQSADGGYILGGYSISGISGDKTQASQGYNDYWIVKTDAQGVKQWDAQFGGNNNDNLFSLGQTADSGYILGGKSSSGISGDKTHASQGSYDYWIVKTDANGVKQWDTQFGGNSEDNLISLQQTAYGGYILGGTSYSGISGDKTQASQGVYDYWVVKTDAEGATCGIPASLQAFNISSIGASVKWDVVSGAISYQISYKSAADPKPIYTHALDNHKIINDLIPNSKYVWQVKSVCIANPQLSSDWSSKQTFTTSPLKTAGDDEEFLNVYPNPFTTASIISFSLPQDSKVLIELYEITGIKAQTIFDEELTAGIHEVNLDRGQSSAGLYFIKVLINGEGLMKKVLIE